MYNSIGILLRTLLFNGPIIGGLIGYLIGILKPVKLPQNLVQLMSLYLVFVIGLKGGSCLEISSMCSGPLYLLAFIGILHGLLQPFLSYYILTKTTKLDHVNAAVIASQYGSVSIVTFMAAVSFLSSQQLEYDNFMFAIAGIMEVPAILTGFFVINLKKTKKRLFNDFFSILTLIMKCKTIQVLVLGFSSGWLLQKMDLQYAYSTIIVPFNTILIFFMVDIGLKIADQRAYFKFLSYELIAFAFYMPILGILEGISITWLLGLKQGTSVLFTVLLATASYIAVPAVMRSYAVGAKEALFMPLVIGITLPFNILVSIPITQLIIGYLTR
jgi:hypothetical protein